MFNATSKKLATTIVVTAVVLTGGGVAVGSSPIQPIQSLSASGQFKAWVSAPDYKTKTDSRIRLYTKKADEWLEQWTLKIAYGSHPGEVHVDNHGCVVSVGNWDHGSNTHALGIYRDGKVVRQHSPEDLANEYGEPDKSRFDPPGASYAGLANQEQRYGSYSCFDPEQRFCIWNDHTRTWIVVDLTDGSLVKPDQETQRYYVEKARKDAYDQIKEKKGKYCFPYYRRLARFLRADDKPAFEELVTRPNPPDFYGGHSSGPGDIYYFVANQYRELAEWVLPAIEDGKGDAIGKVRSFHQRTNYRHLGTLNILAKFAEVPTSSDGIVVIWLETIDASDELRRERPDHTMGINLLGTVSKPLVMPVKMHFFGVLPGKYRVRGFWNKDIDFVHKTNQDFWTRSGQFAIVDAPEFEINKGETLDVAVSFESTN